MTVLESAGVEILPLTIEDAVLAGALASSWAADHCRSATVRSCPGSAQHSSEVLTADRVWVDLDLPLAVRLVR